MPAPIAKGLIIAASVLVAAGIAVYEHPQVQEWVERTRRKIVIAINNLGEPPRPAGRPTEEEVVAAVEAARRKRDEILAKNRDVFVRLLPGRTSSHELQEKTPADDMQSTFDFDAFLNGDGEGCYTLGNTSSACTAPNDQSVRHRTNAVTASPELDEKQEKRDSEVLFDATAVAAESTDRQDEKMSDDTQGTSHAPAAADDETQPLIHLDPEMESQSSSVVLATPPHSDSGHSTDIDQSMSQEASRYFSINEWAESTSPTSHGPPPHAVHSSEAPAGHPAMSDTAEDYPVDVSGDIHDSDTPFSDIISQTSGMHTPATWTEVGSDVSEGDVGEQ